MSAARAPQLRYPYEPLARIVAVSLDLPYCEGPPGCPGCSTSQHAGPAAIGEEIGKSSSALRRWLKEDGIPQRSAEEILERLNLYPSMIPGWLDVWERSIALDVSRGKCSPLDQDDPCLWDNRLFAV